MKREYFELKIAYFRIQIARPSKNLRHLAVFSAIKENAKNGMSRNMALKMMLYKASKSKNEAVIMSKIRGMAMDMYGSWKRHLPQAIFESLLDPGKAFGEKEK